MEKPKERFNLKSDPGLSFNFFVQERRSLAAALALTVAAAVTATVRAATLRRMTGGRRETRRRSQETSG